MIATRRTHGHVIGIVAAAMAIVGCGGSSGESVEAPVASSPASVVAGSELAGVHFDTRRDPG